MKKEKQYIPNSFNHCATGIRDNILSEPVWVFDHEPARPAGRTLAFLQYDHLPLRTLARLDLDQLLLVTPIVGNRFYDPDDPLHQWVDGQRPVKVLLEGAPLHIPIRATLYPFRRTYFAHEVVAAPQGRAGILVREKAISTGDFRYYAWQIARVLSDVYRLYHQDPRVVDNNIRGWNLSEIVVCPDNQLTIVTQFEQ